ncbi:uncharacterized protein DNG_09952 [Cephalotrichum gorgonifer]|uniref:DUF676 domain-containing protein n=1 Tax=Cephalotrichum gorgonifer TaxID=2041049 RepID=A0AAE8SZW3_9PEZI|nr:uncharacterized protein DNG_09952 [Cephalotrichum gorgonifer]
MAQLGLEELSPVGSAERVDLDVVFIHGPFGNRIDTWTKHGVLWPKTLLSEDLPRARILTLGYDSDGTKSNRVTDVSMESYASDLCERLTSFRAGRESSDRPLVFVAYSLGGLLCAQIIVKGALGDGADSMSIIANNTRGIVFLGTPFQGTRVAPWGKIVNAIASVTRKDPTQKVESPDQKSEMLNTLVNSFASVLHQRKRDKREITVTFFHETKKLHGNWIVPKQNSRIPGFGDHASINADHSTMCKFADQDSPGYQSVLAAIKKASVKGDTRLEDDTPVSHVENNNWGTVHNQVLGNQTIIGGMNFMAERGLVE